MLRVFKNIEQYNSSKGSFFNWVYTIIRNAALTLVRDKKSASPVIITEYFSEVDTSHNPFEERDWNIIYLLLGKLPSTTRVVCSLYYLEGFSIKEIAASIDMKEGTVKWHLNESRNRLKNILQPNLKKSV